MQKALNTTPGAVCREHGALGGLRLPDTPAGTASPSLTFAITIPAVEPFTTWLWGPTAWIQIEALPLTPASE